MAWGIFFIPVLAYFHVKQRMRQVLMIVGVCMVLSACKKDPVSLSFDKPVQLNVAYGPESLQKMDLYFPPVRNDSTVMAVMIHGGSWTSGDKSELDTYIPELQKRLPNMAFANINYRLVNGTANRFPTQEEDVQSAIGFLKDHSADFRISGDFVLLGVSAGGHLAMLQGYKHTDQVQPKAIVSLFGPTDLADLYTHPVNPLTPIALIGITGFSLEENPGVYAASSPIEFVHAGSAPTLLLQGAQDSLVSVNQQVMLRDKLEASQVPVTLIVYPNAGHGFYGSNLTDALNQIRDFLKQYVH